MGYNILGLIPCQTPSISLLWKAKTSALGADPSPLFNVSIKDLIVVKFVTRPKLLEFSVQNVDGDKEKLLNM